MDQPAEMELKDPTKDAQGMVGGKRQLKNKPV